MIITCGCGKERKTSNPKGRIYCRDCRKLLMVVKHLNVTICSGTTVEFNKYPFGSISSMTFK